MRLPRRHSSPSFFHPSTNRRIYRFASSGEITPLTQKITSSLSDVFRAGESSRCLICDAKSIIHMSHGAIHASAEGAKVERSLPVTGASDEYGRGGGDIVTRGRNFTTSCLSLSRG